MVQYNNLNVQNINIHDSLVQGLGCAYQVPKQVRLLLVHGSNFGHQRLICYQWELNPGLQCATTEPWLCLMVQYTTVQTDICILPLHR